MTEVIKINLANNSTNTVEKCQTIDEALQKASMYNETKQPNELYYINKDCFKKSRLEKIKSFLKHFKE